jgi:hypothetical protein
LLLANVERTPPVLLLSCDRQGCPMLPKAKDGALELPVIVQETDGGRAYYG